MKGGAIAILRTGLVTSVGLTAQESCVAFRARVTNPSQTRFIGSDGDWIMAHEVPLSQAWCGLTRLAKMAAMAIEEVLDAVPKEVRRRMPLLLCVAEHQRPGRHAGLDDRLFKMVCDELGARFALGSAVIASGRVGVAEALARARGLIAQDKVPQVLIAATDSLLTWPTLSHYDERDRLLTAQNSDGFMPGEGAGALVVGFPCGTGAELLCRGIGLAHESAHIESEEPLRANGLIRAVKAALEDAGLQMHDMAFRITDVSGEQYYFKEAALVLSRILRVRKEEFDIWHPAECIGEAGAASGVAVIAAAQAACDKGYTKGPNVLTHWSNDGGQRAAIALQYRTAP